MAKKIAPLTKEEIQQINWIIFGIIPSRLHPNPYVEETLNCLVSLYERQFGDERDSIALSIDLIMHWGIMQASYNYQKVDQLDWLKDDRAGGKIFPFLTQRQSCLTKGGLKRRLMELAKIKAPLFMRISQTFLLAGFLATYDSKQESKEAILSALHLIAKDIQPEASYANLQDLISYLLEQCCESSLLQIPEEAQSACLCSFIAGLGMLGSKGMFRGFNQNHMPTLRELVLYLELSDFEYVSWFCKLAEKRKIPSDSSAFFESMITDLVSDENAECEDREVAKICCAIGEMVEKGYPLRLSSSGQENFLYLVTLLMANDQPGLEPFKMLQALGWLFNKQVLSSNDKFMQAASKWIKKLFDEEICDEKKSLEQKMIALFFLDSLKGKPTEISADSYLCDLYRRLKAECIRYTIESPVDRYANPRKRKNLPLRGASPITLSTSKSN